MDIINQIKRALEGRAIEKVTETHNGELKLELLGGGVIYLDKDHSENWSIDKN